eukprot:TRINITY_DN6682_c0_g1_i4.p1 TRINITY_DN6682_c0_g1~~TRINITY_DN6682_c0_g1_i4.p1  ORF type:complete len:265 (-),score=20.60 TRINITY_DN6682_c0_g1_i4:124-918(-)
MCIRDRYMGITRSLLALQHLTALHLNFECCDNLTDRSIDGVVDVLQRNKALTQLSLHFQSMMIMDAGIIRLSLSLRSLVCLEKLTISLQRITDEGSCKIADAISSLSTLTQLRVWITHSNITDMTMKSIASALRSLTSLTELDLGFWITGITDDGVSSISCKISKLSQLTSLSLNFAFTRVSDYGIYGLLDNLSLLEKLSSICLFIDECRDITDECAEEIAEFIRKRVSVKEVQISAFDSGITNAGRKAIKSVEATREFNRFIV